MIAHRCHAFRCEVAVPPRLLMCARHWRLVPHRLRQRVWETYVPGQEVRKDPTDAYLAARDAAVEAVARAEMRRDCACCDGAPDSPGPGCACAHSPCVHDLNADRDPARRAAVLS